MSKDNKKARSDGATSEQAGKQANGCENCGNSASALDLIMNEETEQALIVDYIPVGERNALTASELSRFMGTDRRDVTRSIQAARLRGVPICASCGWPRGFYMAEDPDELRRYLQRFRGRLGEILRTYKALKRFLKKWEAVCDG